MADKLKYIPNNDTKSNDEGQNYLFCRLKLMAETFEHSTNQVSLKLTKVVKLGIKKRYYKTLGTSVINPQLSPPSLGEYTPLPHAHDKKIFAYP